jgi:hypothetical protein
MRLARCVRRNGIRPMRRLALVFSLVGAAIGCRGDAGPDAGSTSAVDGLADDVFSAPDPGDVVSPPKPEVRVGLVSGAPCQLSAQCMSGSCTLGLCSDWAHALRIGIDTTADGADIKETLTDFPLLVQLDEGSFPFDLARDDGADLRFVDTSGKNLDYEIERWDSDRGLARIWVLVPTVLGNSVANAILMYFGNPSAVPLSSGADVFSSFDCVLHMAVDSAAGMTQLIDSSGHANHGRLPDSDTIHQAADGIAGDGFLADGAGTYLATSMRLASPATFSTSMWFNTASTAGGGLLSFARNEVGSGGRFDRVVWMDTEGRLSFAVSRENQLSSVRSLGSYSDGKWHFVVARFSEAGQYLMVDGESVADDPTVASVDSYPGYWRFGAAPNLAILSSSNRPPASSNCLAASIDEVRVSSNLESDDWVKLSYVTQRPGGTAVTYHVIP